MTVRPSYHHLEIPAEGGITLPFEMQPIVRVTDERVRAYELLYRGARPANWAKVDAAVIEFFSVTRPGLPPMFINLSNELLITHPTNAFAQVSCANDVTFELSEAMSGHIDRAMIAEKVNQLLDAGVRVALDDFGAGRDGLERLYSIRSVAAVKIDREFLLTCMQRADARRMLSMLVGQWRHEGIKSIAEGVETQEMFAFAEALEVDQVQGWYVDRAFGMNPMSRAE